MCTVHGGILAAQEGINSTRFGSSPALSESRWEKRNFNVRFNEVPKVTAAVGEAPGRSEKG